MHFSISKEVLVRTLKDANRAIKTTPVQVILRNVLIEAEGSTVKFGATDLDFSIQIKAPAMVLRPGKFTAPARLFLDTVNSLPAGDQVEVELSNDSELVIRCKKSRFKIAGEDPSNYPKLRLEGAELFSIPAKDFSRLIKMTAFSAASYDLSSILGGVFLACANGQTEAVATDGSRLAFCQQETDVKSEFSTILPALAATELEAIFSSSAGSIKFARSSSGELILSNDEITTSARTITHEYPRYKELFPSDWSKVAIFQRKELIDSLKRIATLCDSRTNLAVFEIDTDGIAVTSQTPDVGEAKDECAVEYYEGFAIKFRCNLRYVLDVLNRMTDPKVRLEMTEPEKPLIFRDQSTYKYLLMPVRVA